MFVKGAPEEVLLHCSRMSTTEGETPITEGLVNEFTVSVIAVLVGEKEWGKDRGEGEGQGRTRAELV